MARKPEVGDYAVIYNSRKFHQVVAEGYIWKVGQFIRNLPYEGIVYLNDIDGGTIFNAVDGDYIIPKELLESKIGKLLWTK